MKRILYSALVILTVFYFSGCTIAKISGRGTLPLVLNNLPVEAKIIEHIEESKMIVFDYTSSFDASEVLKNIFKKYPEADAVTNLVITLKSDVGTFFINLFTLGLANAKTIVIEGDIVKLPKGFKSSQLDSKSFLGDFSFDDAIMLKSESLSNYVIIKEAEGLSIFQ